MSAVDSLRWRERERERQKERCRPSLWRYIYPIMYTISSLKPSNLLRVHTVGIDSEIKIQQHRPKIPPPPLENRIFQAQSGGSRAGGWRRNYFPDAVRRRRRRRSQIPCTRYLVPLPPPPSKQKIQY